MLRKNKTQQMCKTSHMTCDIKSEHFISDTISEKRCYTMLKFVDDIGSRYYVNVV